MLFLTTSCLLQVHFRSQGVNFDRSRFTFSPFPASGSHFRSLPVYFQSISGLRKSFLITSGLFSVYFRSQEVIKGHFRFTSSSFPVSGSHFRSLPVYFQFISGLRKSLKVTSGFGLRPFPVGLDRSEAAEQLWSSVIPLKNASFYEF